MRGSTLLLHWKSEATLMRVQLRSALHLSWIADLAPFIGSLLSLDRLLFFINVGAMFIGCGFSITEMERRCKSYFAQQKGVRFDTR